MRIERFRFSDFTAPPEPALAGESLSVDVTLPEDVSPPPAPMFSQEALEEKEKEATRRGHTEGYKAGAKDAQTEAHRIEKSVEHILSSLAMEVGRLSQEQDEYLRSHAKDLAALCLAAAKKVAGKALTATPLAEIEHMIHESAEMLVGHPRITVTVHPSLAERLKEHVKQKMIDGDHESQIIVMTDATLDTQDCRITWKHGEAERSQTRLWSDIDAVLTRRIEALDMQQQAAAATYVEPEVAQTAQESSGAPGADTLQQDEGAETQNFFILKSGDKHGGQ